MNRHEGFDRTIASWLDVEAGRGAPGYLDEVLARTSQIRQRPAWSSPERWLPVQLTARFVPVPRVAWLLVILALVVAIGFALLTIGAPKSRPLPFGPAANGSIVYGTAAGDIIAFDPAARTSTAIIVGATNDETPDFSPDGSRFVFARETPDRNRWQLMVADADGSDIRPLTGPILPAWNAWSPDSTRVAVVNTASAVDTLSIISLDGTETEVLPLDGLAPDRVQWRSPTELVFLGRKGVTHGLYTISTDGSTPRELLPATTVDTDWLQPVLSPDGTRLVYTKWVVDGPVIHVHDLATGKDVVPVYDGTAEGDGWPTWSPDGTKLLFSRWDGKENRLAVGPVGGGHVVTMGPGFPDFTDGAVGVFSPDGTLIVARYGFDPEATWLLDPAGGAGERVLTGVSGSVSWQRTAR